MTASTSLFVGYWFGGDAPAARVLRLAGGGDRFSKSQTRDTTVLDLRAEQAQEHDHLKVASIPGQTRGHADISRRCDFVVFQLESPSVVAAKGVQAGAGSPCPAPTKVWWRLGRSGVHVEDKSSRYQRRREFSPFAPMNVWGRSLLSPTRADRPDSRCSLRHQPGNTRCSCRPGPRVASRW